MRGQAVEHLFNGRENGILRLEHRELDVVCAGCAFQFEPLHGPAYRLQMCIVPVHHENVELLLRRLYVQYYLAQVLLLLLVRINASVDKACRFADFLSLFLHVAVEGRRPYIGMVGVLASRLQHLVARTLAKVDGRVGPVFVLSRSFLR